MKRQPAAAVQEQPDALDAPLSPAQRAIWFTQSRNPQATFYNRVQRFRLAGPLHYVALTRALRFLTARHSVLRTRFAVSEGQPQARIAAEVAFDLPLHRLSPGDDAAAQMQELLRQHTERPFDLANELPLRVLLVQEAPERYTLAFVHHSIAFDHESLALFAQELSHCYNAFAAGGLPALPALPFTYVEYAAWQLAPEQEERIERASAYWRAQLAPAPPALELPTDRPPRLAASFAADAVDFCVPPATLRRLTALALSEEATLFMLLLASLQTLLSRYTQLDDIAVGALVSVHQPAGSERLLGNFSNQLVLRSDLAGDLSFRRLLRQVRATTHSAYAHQEAPLGRLVEQLRPARSGQSHPFFQLLLDYQETPQPRLALQGLTVTPLACAGGESEFPLTVTARLHADHLALRLHYQRDLFAASAIQRMAGHWSTLLAAIAADPDQPLAEAPLLTAQERRQILHDWNPPVIDDTDPAGPGTGPAASLVEQFAHRVARHPQAAAFVAQGGQLSYQELHTRSNQLAHYLQRNGVKAGTRVGVCLERSLDSTVAVLAVFKLAAVYVPLDPAYPQERLRYIVADSDVEVVVTSARWQGLLAAETEPDVAGPDETGPGVQPASSPRMVSLDAAAAQLAQMPTDALVDPVDPGQTAYMIYTSGSTGAPKGVEVPHRQILNRLRWMWEAYPFDAGEVGSHKMALSFVDSLWELFGYLLQGVPTVILSDEAVRDPLLLVETLARHGVTRLWLVPAQLRLLLHTLPDLAARLPRLRFWVATGEPLPVDLALAFQEKLPHAVLYNLYGTSEVWDATWYDPAREEQQFYSSIVPIGRPIRNVQTLILDRNRQLAPVGVSGELYVGGLGLGTGYYKRPQLTAERFFAHPLASDSGGRLYRTGDVARLLPDGNIEFLGRIDHQVKLRGFRLELGEIETLLREREEVRDAAVVLRGEGESQQLAAYLTATDGRRLPVAALRDHLSRRLPAYMLPASFTWVEEMPHTPSGKIDRKALAALSPAGAPTEQDAAADAALYVGPRSALEARMAALWAEVLGVEQVSIHDDFFALGGHSLLGVRLFVRIEEELGRRLPMALLFDYPTVAQLTMQFSAPTETQPAWETLVPIQSGGERPPFFCVHGFGGGVVGYAQLAQALGPEQPFYGLQAKGLDGKEPPHTSIEAMASHYIAAMRALQPHGPYRIGGYCLGGEVAFEMARQLEAAGEAVAHVAIIEGYAPAEEHADHGFLHPDRLRIIARNLPYWWEDYWRLEAAELRGRLRRSAVAAWRTLLRKAGRSVKAGADEYVPHDLSLLPAHKRHIMEVELHASQNYRPGRYGGGVTLYRAQGLTINRALFGSLDRKHGWGKLAAQVDVLTVAGGHQDLYLPPHVESLAAALRASLDAALD